jgi:hypothetical protein
VGRVKVDRVFLLNFSAAVCVCVWSICMAWYIDSIQCTRPPPPPPSTVLEHDFSSVFFFFRVRTAECQSLFLPAGAKAMYNRRSHYYFFFYSRSLFFLSCISLGDTRIS